jgi:LysR family transcriptional activator of mexEF-oprN operon
LIQQIGSIVAIDHINLGRLDLNLLIAFDALALEKSVTRAAARVGIGQSAMSHALSRLRMLFDDELFVRFADGMRPTPKALTLIEPVRSALAATQAVLLQHKPFDPATAERTFFIGMPDSIELTLLPRLLARVHQNAPGIVLRTRGSDKFQVLDQLDQDLLHLAIGEFHEGGMHHKRRGLYKANYLCLYDPAQVPIEGELTLEAYLSYPHVLLGSITTKPHGVVDDILAARGLARHVGATAEHFVSVPYLLQAAPLISTCVQPAAGVFASNFGLSFSAPPLPLPDIHISMLWHSSYDADPAHRWLREAIVDVLQ